MTSKFFERENALLKRLFSEYLSPTTVDATIIGYRDRDYNVLAELRHDLELTKFEEHPLYSRSAFDSKEDMDRWRESRLADLAHKIKMVEKQPSFTGKLTVTVLGAEGLNANNERAEGNSSIYFMVKVADRVERSTQYVENTWNPNFTLEPFTFDVPSKDCRIKIELWDKNFIGSTFLGCVMAKPRDLMWIDMPYEKWWPLGSRTRTKDTGISGRLLLKFNFSFQIGPYRVHAPMASKSPFASLFSNSSSSSSSAQTQSTGSSSSNASPSSSNSSSHRNDSSNNNHHDAFSDAGNSSANSPAGAADSESLPAPPPIVNSHLNDYPEWFTSLLMIALKDALLNPPPSLQNSSIGSVSEDGSSESANSGPAGLSTTPVSISSTPRPSATPLRSSPSVSGITVSGVGANQNFLPPSSSSRMLHDTRHEKRSSAEYVISDLQSSFASVASSGSAGGVGGSSYGSNSTPFRSTESSSPVEWGSSSMQGLSSGRPAPILSDSPTHARGLAQSMNDLLTSSSGSLSRSAPSIRALTPQRKMGGHSRIGTNGSGAIDEEPAGEEPVRYSAEIKWLLDCFVERFTIDICLAPLLNIELLDTSFEPRSLAHMDALHASLVEFESAKALSPLRWNRVVHLNEVVVCENLKNHLDDALTNYFWRFPKNEPKGALAQAIVLYSMVTRSELPQLCIILHDKIEANMIRMYKTLVGEKPGEPALWDAVRLVSQAIETDLKFFNDVFPENLMLASMSMRTYYSELLAKNLKAWLRTSPPITDITMTLYAHLNRLHSQINRIQASSQSSNGGSNAIGTNNYSAFGAPNIELLPVATLFQPFVGKWIEHVGDNLPQWCKYDLLRRETWRAPNNPSNTASGHSILHSASAQILFEAFSRVYTQYRQFDMRTAKDLKALVKIFVQTIEGYMQVMAGKAVDIFAIPGAPRGSRSVGSGGRFSPSMSRNSPLSSRSRTGSSGDIFALARDSPTLNSSFSANSDSPASPRYGSNSSSFWSSFGIVPLLLPSSCSSSSSKSKVSSDRGLFQIPIESCVWISTLETMSQKLYDFCKQISSDAEKGSEEVRGWFSDTFAQMQQLENQISQLIIKLVNTNPSLELALDTLLSYSPDIEKVTDQDVLVRLEPLFDYIASRVETLSAHLDYKVFLRVMEQIWLLILKDIEVLTFPIISDRKADAKRAHFIEFALPFLVSYFHAREDGSFGSPFSSSFTASAAAAAQGLASMVGYGSSAGGSNAYGGGASNYSAHGSNTSYGSGNSGYSNVGGGGGGGGNAGNSGTAFGGSGGASNASHSSSNAYEGLSLEFLEGEAVVLKTCFAMLKCPTGVLCKAYSDIANGLSPTGIPGSDGIDPLLLETRIIAVLSMRKNDKEAKKFVKANQLATMNRYTLRSFDLPKGETVVDWFTCRKGKDNYVSGYLYVTTNWLCFDTYLWGDHMLTIPLSEIRSLKRKKTTLSTNGITIRLRDPSATTLQFSAISKIKAYDVIVEQAEKMGYILETYDKNEDSSTKEKDRDSRDSKGSSKRSSSDRDSREGKDKDKDKSGRAGGADSLGSDFPKSPSHLKDKSAKSPYKDSKSGKRLSHDRFGSSTSSSMGSGSDSVVEFSDLSSSSSSAYLSSASKSSGGKEMVRRTSLSVLGSAKKHKENSSSSSSSSSTISLKASQHLSFVSDALLVSGAKRIDNEEELRSYFGLGSKGEDAIVSFDCSLMLEPKERERSPSISSLGAATPSQAGVLYCFTKSICFRCPSHKLVLSWNSVSNLGQRGTDGILIVTKEKKKSKQHCLTKFAAPDDVFALLHSIWVKATS